MSRIGTLTPSFSRAASTSRAVLARPPPPPFRQAARPFSSAHELTGSTLLDRTGRYAPFLVTTAAIAALALTRSLLSPPLLLEEHPALTSEHDHLEGTKQPSGQKLISYKEVEKHKTQDDCWVIIDGKIYDVTDFLEQHPGGANIILANAGKDATKIYKPLHPPDALEVLAPEQHIGPVDPLTMPEPVDTGPTEEEKQMEEARKHMPAADAMLLLRDFEEWGEKVLSGTAWNYYKSAADREISAEENEAAFRRYFFRPRILHDVTTGTIDTTFLGVHSEIPIYIAPAAMAKLGHPLGEVNLTKGAGNAGIVQGISINASCSIDEIMAARQEGQKVFFQIYLNKDRKVSEALLQKVTKLGAAAIIFTVDTAYKSKRTRDVRAKTPVEAPVQEHRDIITVKPKKSKSPSGVGNAISGYQDTNLTWSDIDFIRKNTNLPLIIKGVQSVEDVELCAKAGVEGVMLSNHGGRQLDYAPAPIDLLYELRANRPDLFDQIEVFIDGGIRSGADVVKALALGAKAVGLGRPFLYANGTHGQEGVERVCEILAEEITNSMRNCGVTHIKDLKPDMVGPAGPWVKGNMSPWMAAKS